MGKFDPKKAAELGLRPGPKYRELQLGNPVMSDRDNNMVKPSDVLSPSIPGPTVILVDCPTKSHLEELKSIQSFCCYYNDTSDKTVNCVIHLSPASVANTDDYQKWMSRFGGTQHIMAGHKMKNIEVPILESSARIAVRLNYLSPQLFPASVIQSSLEMSTSGFAASDEAVAEKRCDSVAAENLLKFCLRPISQLGLDRSSIPTLSATSEIIQQLLSEIPESEEAKREISLLLNADKETIDEMPLVEDDQNINENSLPNCLKDINREDTEIVFLGTGSAQPSKHRNVSSILINRFSKGSFLLDCGEGTLAQLIRRFGKKGADDIVRGLKFIWISHIHGDHQLGLVRLLVERRKLLNGNTHEPLIVVGPRPLKRFLDAYTIEDLDIEFLDCRHTTEDSLNDFELEQPHNNENKDTSIVNLDLSALKKLKKALVEAGLEALTSFPVMHCPEAFGVALKAVDRINVVGEIVPGWKIVYSGDTRPCDELVRSSFGATVLIHEATFEDGLLNEAIAKNHSTTTEAIETGKAAGAYRIILTHFSQRYPKIPVFDTMHMHNTCIAFDLMSVNLADIHVLPKVFPYLKLLFKDDMILEESDDIVPAT